MKKTTAERFASMTRSEGDCLIWIGFRDPKGYGRFNRGPQLSSMAHRYAYEVCFGPVPAGLFIDHLCRNRACVNADHLEAVSNHENTMRGENFIARNARATHCPRGHPYDESNTYRLSGGRRDCRACCIERARVAKRRAAV